MSRWLPYPLLTLSLLVMWVLLNGFTPGHVLLGGVIAIFASRAMSLLMPAKPRLRRWDLVPKLVGTVLIDVSRSNVAVARLIFQGRAPASGFVVIPLDLRDRTGLAVLACIITCTPGTAWVEYDSVSGALVIHVLDLADEAAWTDTVKSHYESLLMEIFE